MQSDFIWQLPFSRVNSPRKWSGSAWNFYDFALEIVKHLFYINLLVKVDKPTPGLQGGAIDSIFPK